MMVRTKFASEKIVGTKRYKWAFGTDKDFMEWHLNRLFGFSGVGVIPTPLGLLEDIHDNVFDHMDDCFLQKANLIVE